MIRHVFVYGTLRPGDTRWPLLAPFVVDDGWDDRAPGRLFDTGLGYPAAVFDRRERTDPSAAASPGTIHGRTFALLEPSLDRCLEVLDAEEGTVRGLYRRVEITTAIGVRAWAYEYGSGLDLAPIEGGDWLAR